MANETVRLAEYAASLRFDDIPSSVIERAKQCIIDTVAVVTQGSTLPWSQIVARYAQRVGAGGSSRILGIDGPAVQAPAAALANGAFAHAFESDNLTKPGAGVHPGGTLLPPALAVAQERHSSGRDLITAVVAGFEVMYRIGHATKHSNERRGFHAPGTTGPFGAAIAAGHLLGLDAARMTNALGIAGSLAGGLMEFARSGTGAMVKRLHLGRASESGVLAASLAADGFTGPRSVLEGDAGFLKVFCTEWDIADLTHGLGTDYATMHLCLKRFPMHMTAHTAVQAVLELQAEHGFTGDAVQRVTVVGNERMATVNNIRDPRDVMMAQYSIPFCVALACFRDPRDPASFDESVLSDAAIRDLCGRVSVVAGDSSQGIGGAAVTTITLRDGRSFTREVTDYNGTPARPLNRGELRDKFVTLTRMHYGDAGQGVFERLVNLENEQELAWVGTVPVSLQGA
ncbi:MAG TPA: MmgE/PrpD family protein [Acetobacteraceae bacterium]|jgi:2-methylcitrate dehydratase PrpD|nr:MmgE/PrpD family protein [Acetobacteraceae bacterium]